MQESFPYNQFPVDLNNNYGGATLLPPIGNDEPLVRTYLLHFLRDAADAKEFEPYVNDIYLKHLLAEVKITSGLGDAEKWASLLPPEQYKQLKERVDIDFAFTNKTSYAADEAVALLRTALAKEPESSEGYTQLAMAYGRKGDLAQADLSSALAAVVRGDARTARDLATRAKTRFPVGSPGWVRVWRRPAADDAPGRGWVLVAELVSPAVEPPK